MKLFVLGLTVTTHLFAADFLKMLDLEELRWGMMQEEKALHFEKEEVGRSDGYLCDGTHFFKVSFDALMKEVDFDLHEKHLDAFIDLKNLYGRADGKYRSIKSLCVPVSGWLGLASDWARLEVRIHLEEQPNSELPKVRLEVLKSQVGTLHFGNGVPAWIENAVTGIVDRVLSEIWNTRLGDWIEAKITAQIQKKIQEEAKR